MHKLVTNLYKYTNNLYIGMNLFVLNLYKYTNYLYNLHIRPPAARPRPLRHNST